MSEITAQATGAIGASHERGRTPIFMFSAPIFRVQIENKLKYCFSVLYEILRVLKKRVVFKNGFFLRFSFGLYT